jgi:hypothetical protein
LQQMILHNISKTNRTPHLLLDTKQGELDRKPTLTNWNKQFWITKNTFSLSFCKQLPNVIQTSRSHWHLHARIHWSISITHFSRRTKCLLVGKQIWSIYKNFLIGTKMGPTTWLCQSCRSSRHDLEFQTVLWTLSLRLICCHDSIPVQKYGWQICKIFTF